MLKPLKTVTHRLELGKRFELGLRGDLREIKRVAQEYKESPRCVCYRLHAPFLWQIQVAFPVANTSRLSFYCYSHDNLNFC
jgi:hypothetical protein